MIKYSVEGSVAKITLNRPAQFNAFLREMALQFQQALREAADAQSIRAIYITGEGKAFCAGQDLREAIAANGTGIKKIVEEHYNPVILLLRTIEKPVVCAVNGAAAGAGANIALACDVVFAAKSAYFLQAFSKIGLVPDSGGTFHLPRLIGFGKASALFMLGEKVFAEEAEKWGMIYKAVTDDKLQEEAFAAAKLLSTMPTKGIGLTKRLLNKSMSNSLEEQLQQEAIEQMNAAKTYDYSEGVKAFLEKRKPIFRGE